MCGMQPSVAMRAEVAAQGGIAADKCATIKGKFAAERTAVDNSVKMKGELVMQGRSTAEDSVTVNADVASQGGIGAHECNKRKGEFAAQERTAAEDCVKMKAGAAAQGVTAVDKCAKCVTMKGKVAAQGGTAVRKSFDHSSPPCSSLAAGGTPEPPLKHAAAVPHPRAWLWFAAKGAVVGWGSSGGGTADLQGLEQGYRGWRVEQSRVGLLLFLYLTAISQAVLAYRVISQLFYGHSDLPSAALPGLALSNALQFSQLVHALVLILGPKRWRVHHGSITMGFDCVVMAILASWLVCPIPFGENFKWTVKVSFSSDDLPSKMQPAAIFCLIVRVGMLQLPPPRLLLSSGLWTVMLGACMWAADPQWYLFGEGSYGYPGLCHTLLCAGPGLAIAVWFEAKQRLQYLQSRQVNDAAGALLEVSKVAKGGAEQEVGGGMGPGGQQTEADCTACNAESAMAKQHKAARQTESVVSSLQSQAQEGAGEQKAAGREQSMETAVQSVCAPTMLSPVSGPEPQTAVHARTMLNAACVPDPVPQAGEPSLAVSAVRVAQSSKSRAELRAGLVALMGNKRSRKAGQSSSLYKGRTQYYTVSMKIDDGNGAPVAALQKAAVSATCAAAGELGHVQYVVAPVTFPGCWRLVLMVASVGEAEDGGQWGMMSEKGLQGSVTKADWDFSGLSSEIEALFLADADTGGATLLQPVTYTQQSPVRVLPTPVALSTAGCTTSVIEGQALVLTLPSQVLGQIADSADCLKVVVSPSHGCEVVCEQTWTVEELRALPSDEDGNIQVTVQGLNAHLVELESHMLPLLVVNVLQQPTDHSTPDRLLACCAVPVLPAEQCAEMCDIFSTMLSESGAHLPPSRVYHDTYLPLVWDLACALSPSSMSAVVAAAGVSRYAGSGRELLLFLWSQSMWHCLEAAVVCMKCCPGLADQLMQAECPIEREVLQLLLDPAQAGAESGREKREIKVNDDTAMVRDQLHQRTGRLVDITEILQDVEPKVDQEGDGPMLEYSPSSKPCSSQTNNMMTAWDTAEDGPTTEQVSLDQPRVASLGEREGSVAPLPDGIKASWSVAARGALLGWSQSAGWKGLESQYQQRLLTQSQLAVRIFLCLDAFSSIMVIGRMITGSLWEPETYQAMRPTMLVNCICLLFNLARSLLFLLGPRTWWCWRGCITMLLECAVFVVVVPGLILACPGRVQVCAEWLVSLSLPAQDRRAKMQLVVVFYVVLRVAMQQIPPPWLLPAAVIAAVNVCMTLGNTDPDWFLKVVGGNVLPGWASIWMAGAAGVCIVVGTQSMQRLSFLKAQQKKKMQSTGVSMTLNVSEKKKQQ